MSEATTTDIDSVIGSRVAAARERFGWNREALAFHSGLSWSAISQIESGRRTNVRPTTLSALADALGVTVDYLLGRSGGANAMFEHDALLYATHDEFAEHAGDFIAEGVERSQATLAVTNAPKLTLLRRRLGSDASRVTFADAKRWYRNPGDALASYRSFVEQSLDSGAGWIRIVGEPVWSGKSEDEALRWTRYESLLNLEFAGLPVSLICPYDAEALDSNILDHARVTHPRTRERGELLKNREYRNPSDFALGG